MTYLDTLPVRGEGNRVITDHIASSHGGKTDCFAIPHARAALPSIDGHFL